MKHLRTLSIVLFLFSTQFVFAQRVDWINEFPDSVYFYGSSPQYSLIDDDDNYVSVALIQRTTSFDFFGQTIPGNDSFQTWLYFKFDRQGSLLWTLRLDQQNVTRVFNNQPGQTSPYGISFADGSYFLTLQGYGADFYTYFNGTPQDTIRHSGRVGNIDIWKISKNGKIEWTRSLFKKKATNNSSYAYPRLWYYGAIGQDNKLRISFYENIQLNQFAADSTFIQVDSSNYKSFLFYRDGVNCNYNYYYEAVYDFDGNIDTVQFSFIDSLFVYPQGYYYSQNSQMNSLRFAQVFCGNNTVSNGYQYVRGSIYFVESDSNKVVKPKFSHSNWGGVVNPSFAYNHNLHLAVMPTKFRWNNARISDTLINYHENKVYELDTLEFVLFDKDYNFMRRKRLFKFNEGYDSVFFNSSYYAFSESEIYISGYIQNLNTSHDLNFLMDGISYQIPAHYNSRYLLKLDTFLNVLWLKLDTIPINSQWWGNFTSMQLDSRGDLYLTINQSANTNFEIFGDSIFGRAMNFQSLVKISDYSITRGEISAGPYCAGDSFNIPYEAIGVFDSANQFIAQLSDEDGNFDDTSKIRDLGKIKTGESDTIRGELPLFEVSSSGNYRIRIISTHPPVQSFYRRDSLRLLIYSRDKADPGPTETVCREEPFTLNTFGGTTWEWSPSINMDDSTLRRPTIIPDSTRTYRIVIGDSSGCGDPDTAFKQIIVRSDPFTVLPQNPIDACHNLDVLIPASFQGGDSAAYSWKWYYLSNVNNWILLKEDSLKLADTLSFRLPSNVLSSRFIAVIMTDHCSPKVDTAFVTIRLSSQRMSSVITQSNIPACYMQDQTLMADFFGGDSGSYTWSWYSLDNDSTFTILKSDDSKIADTLDYTPEAEIFEKQLFAIVSRDQCTPFLDTVYYSLNIDQSRPIATITPLDSAICPESQIVFESTLDSGSVLGYHWKWMDQDGQVLSIDTGFVISELELTPNFESDNTREYYLIASDNCSPYSDTAEVRVFARETLEVTPSTFDTTLCSGQEITLASSGFGGVEETYAFRWLAKDSEELLSETDELTLIADTTTSLLLVLSDGCMPENDTVEVLINVRAPIRSAMVREPHHDIPVLDTTVCSGSELEFFAKGFGGDSSNYSYEWYLDDNLIGSDSSISVLLSGVEAQLTTHNLTLIINDNCTVKPDTQMIAITVLPPLDVSFATPDTLCLGEEIEFFANGSGGIDSTYSFEWFATNSTGDWILKGDSDTVNFTPSDLNNSTLNTQHLKLVLSDGCSSPNDTFVHEIYIRPALSLDLSASDLCANPTTTLTANPAGGNPAKYIIQWEATPGPSSGGEWEVLGTGLSIEVTPNQLTTYRAILTDGCSADTAFAQVQIDLIPSTLELLASPIEGCEPLEVEFEVITNYPNSFNAFVIIGNDSLKTQNLKFNTVLYQSTPSSLYIITQSGCSITVPSQEITVHPKPIASFSYLPETPDMDSAFVQFNNNSSGASNYLWTINPFGDFTDFEPQVEYLDTGYFDVTHIAISDQDCRDTANGTVYIRTNYRVFLPDAFSPNGDGLNDVFRPSIRGYSEMTFRVYNRWGELLFETRSDQGWDGTFQGEIVQGGVYFYTLNIINYLGERQSFKGTVQLVR